MFKFIFLDLDDTLLDFHKAEALAIARTFREVGLEPTDELIARYSRVNKLHWEMLERGELTRAQVRVQRFGYLFRELGLDADPRRCQELYEAYLCIGHYYIDGAMELLDYLKPKYRLYLASNGTARVQDARLKSSGIGAYLDDQFISERMGADKPTLEFFKRSFDRIPDFDPERAMIIGDSLTSDIRGGNNAGIKTCWFNPRGITPSVQVQIDYEIHRLNQLKTIL